MLCCFYWISACLTRDPSCTALHPGSPAMHHRSAVPGATLGHRLFEKPAMLDPKFLEDLSARVSAALAHTPAADIEKNLRAMLTAGFSRLDLVTREDFEIQKDLLARAQSRLAELEARLAAIENRRPG
jgi:BMFP domain-containing protein YqiC